MDLLPAKAVGITPTPQTWTIEEIHAEMKADRPITPSMAIQYAQHQIKEALARERASCAKRRPVMQPDLEDGEIQQGPILDRLRKPSYVLYVERMEDGTFRLREACDGVFSVRLTADELRALAGELINIAGRPSAT